MDIFVVIYAQCAAGFIFGVRKHVVSYRDGVALILLAAFWPFAVTTLISRKLTE
jgi:hypothetical protein